MKRLLLVFSLLITLPIYGQIAYDNVSPDTAVADAGATSVENGTSWAIAGSNRYLVGFAGSGASTPVTPATMLWGSSGGTSMGALATGTAVGANGYTRSFGLVTPSASTTTLYATWGSAQEERIIGGVSYTGVDQTTPLRNSGAATTQTGNYSGVTSDTWSITVPNTVSGDVVVAGFFTVANGAPYGATCATSGGSTIRYNVVISIDYETMCIAEVTATGTSTTVSVAISFAMSPANGGWAAHAVAMIPAGAGPSTTQVNTLQNLGAGFGPQRSQQLGGLIQ